MRLYRIFNIQFAFALCLFTLTLIIVFKSSQDIKLVVQFTPQVNKSQHFLTSDNKLKSDSKWTVLKDGTVIHLGNHSLSLNYSYLINNENICKEFSSKSLKLLILIESNAINLKGRQIIRETWGLRPLQLSINYRIVFLVGFHPNTTQNIQIQNEIRRENLIYGDLIQLGIVESFRNLTLKSILSLKWYLEFCPEADFYFKTDDDIYIHVPNLLSAFQNFKNSNNSILCHENKTKKIIRNYALVSQMMQHYRQSFNRHEIVNDLKKKIYKYIVNFSQLPGVYYPLYCSGFGYGFSLQVAQRLYEAALTIPYFFIEDVFVTGFCRYKANIHITDSELINLKPVLSPEEGNCAFNRGRINGNEMSTQQIKQLWININTQGLFCPNLVNNVNKSDFFL